MNTRSSILKQKAEEFLRLGLYQQGLHISEGCLKLDPNNSSLHLNKAFFFYRLGDLSRALAEINQAISLDSLNYHAYFNLFSIQMESGQFEAAFKNLCCCLSVGHLLVGKKTNDPSNVEKAIEFCFNNKQARALRCLQKLKEGKKIEALNQINYALYLDPSHPLLLTIQTRVYQDIGMKELKPLPKGPQRPRFEKLETCKDIPAADIIQTQIHSLLQEFNSLLRRIAEPHVFLIPSYTPSKDNTINQNNVDRKINAAEPQTPALKLANIKKVVPKAVQSFEESTRDVYCAAGSRQKESTIIGEGQKTEYFIPQQKNSFLQESRDLLKPLESSFQRLNQLEISKISQNSRRPVRGKMLDISQCLKSLVQKSQETDTLLFDQSLQEIGEGSQVQLKLPIDSLKLRPDQKVVLALQRVRKTQTGQREEPKEMYEIEARGEKLQLIKGLVPI